MTATTRQFSYFTHYRLLSLSTGHNSDGYDFCFRGRLRSEHRSSQVSATMLLEDTSSSRLLGSAVGVKMNNPCLVRHWLAIEMIGGYYSLCVIVCI